MKKLVLIVTILWLTFIGINQGSAAWAAESYQVTKNNEKFEVDSVTPKLVMEEVKQGETLQSMGIFTSVAEENEFISLVGRDYDKFLTSFALITSKQDLDGFNAKVFAGNVRGLFTIKEAIIMINGNGTIWAAVIDGNQVKFFTNSKGEQVIPKTVEKWRERFKEKEIILIR
ncbi:hypothetical protein [Pelosinus sp. UFO1]|uniref:hypothetical protein n=1 Tax=Pelosinus sp. UFO1 TaxID=484770 RepID=UPI0004D14A38|nr:hypothetical protein [Pelosinus sp. UFO1]AIF54184.1 hypothetical protein UFO1_4649 [Pelosinus sp. UFO1]